MSGYDIKHLLKSLNWLAFIDRRRRQVARQQADLAKMMREHADEPGLWHARLALDYGMAMAQAELA
jgi:hypothetical protein